MKNIFFLLYSCLSLTSCTLCHVQHMDIEQGNILTADQIHALHPGMSQADVEKIVGTPVLLNTFRESQVDYIYTFLPAAHAVAEKRLVLSFDKGILKKISRGNS